MHVPRTALALATAIALQQCPAVTAQTQSTKSSARAQDARAGTITAGVYRNSYFGFTYKIPFGWVERTKDMQDEAPDAAKALVLLAVFERPPSAPGDSVNSAVVIAAESVAAYPGLKDAAQYFGPLAELTTAQGFKARNEPYEFVVGTKKLARGDFSKTLDKLTMHQGSLVMLQKESVVSFTMIGGSEDEVEGLIGNLSFGARK